VDIPVLLPKIMPSGPTRIGCLFKPDNGGDPVHQAVVLNVAGESMKIEKFSITPKKLKAGGAFKVALQLKADPSVADVWVSCWGMTA
jgi:hypothetical protein